ncbi:MAG: hypothetical protein JW832_07010 [Deltaproteobacteria bacterium]|nr:hypothetical protein [Deltaproteobacteria bacterium]
MPLQKLQVFFLQHIRKIDAACTVFIFLTPVVLALGVAVSCGLHTCDDQVAATGARYLASGWGYTLPQPMIPDKIAPFTPWFTQGPAIILPVALAMYVFGTSDIVPPVAAVSLWALLFALILLVLYRQPRRCLFAPVVLAIVFGVFGLFGLHFEQWTTMLGEVHGALFFVLGIAFFATATQSGKSNLIAGTVIGLSLTSKLIMLFALPGIVLAVIVRLAFEERRFSIQLRYFLALAIGIALPAAVYELCKMWFLGLGGYADNIKAFASMMQSQGVSGGNALFDAAGISGKLWVLKTRFFLSPAKISLIVVLTGLLAFKIRNNKKLKIFYFAAVASSACLYAYWLFLSKGWARYAVAALVIHLFAMGAACIELRWKEALAVLALLLVLWGGGMKHMNHELSAADNGLFRASGARMERLKVAAFVQEKMAASKASFVTQWWATGMDIQYFLSRGLYIGLASEMADDAGPTYLITNKRYQTGEQKAETGAFPKERYVFDGRQYSIINITGSPAERFKKWRY